jgi:hypothetical protein
VWLGSGWVRIFCIDHPSMNPAMTKSNTVEQRQQRQQRLQKLIVTGAILSATCAQYTMLIMSGITSKEQQKAVWSPEETDAFVDYLVAHHSEAGDGGNFKTVTFTAAAREISPLLKFGPPKTERMCKTKWSSVSDSIPCAPFSHTDAYAQLKSTYAAILKYQTSTSGTHWDNINGANITTIADQDVWENYIKVR